MDPTLKSVSMRMYDFGCHTLGRAIREATFSEYMNPFSHATSVTLAANAGEVIVKARIAEEHPLLIFESLPKTVGPNGLLGLKELYASGRTITYSELPDILWATTGYRMNRKKEFLEFGKLRNSIVHFAVPDEDLAEATLRYAFEVIDPLIEEFLKGSIVPFAEVWDDVIASEGYLGEQLSIHGIVKTKSTKKYLLSVSPDSE